MANQIWIVPFFGQGHLFPLMELCKHLASRNFKAVLVISSKLSSSIPPSLRQYPLIEIAEISEEEAPPPSDSDSSSPPQPHRHHGQMSAGLENLLSTRKESHHSALPLCAILDNMMSWTSEIFQNFEIPAVSFFTSGACSAAMEYALWKAHPLDVKPGETRLLPGLPEQMAVTFSDIKRQSRPPPFHMGKHGPPPPGGPGAEGNLPHGPGGPGPKRMGPPKPGEQPHWLDEIERSIGVMINTCDELEHPFIEYVSNKIEKPVWGVGPLLPEQYWNLAGSVLHDRDVRANRKSNFTEDEVNAWLDTKARGSVLYVSFGSEVGPTKEEYAILAEALEESTRPFIWVVQTTAGKPRGPPPGLPQLNEEPEEAYFPHGLDTRVGKRGLIIQGWAPQLLILSHPSTGGFLSHCGWNSTVEAIGRGVPFLAWPIRGDQHFDAKLVASYLEIGYLISEDLSEKINKDDIVSGIEKLLSDEDVKRRAVRLGAKFENGFPASSVAALDAFGDFLRHLPIN